VQRGESSPDATLRQSTRQALLAQEVKLLIACHDDNPIAKFWGACNVAKAQLDECFRVSGAVVESVRVRHPDSPQIEKKMRRAVNASRNQVDVDAMLADLRSREASAAVAAGEVRKP
jgi:hypothetical protein